MAPEKPGTGQLCFPDYQRLTPAKNRLALLGMMAALVATIILALLWNGANPAGAQSAPTITAVEITSDPGPGNTYGIGDTIRVQVTFSETVDVTGTPRLKIDMDPAEWGEKWASYDSGSGTTALVFTYTVVEPNISTQGIAVVENTLELNGGTIRSGDVDAALTHTGRAHDANHKVYWPLDVVDEVEVTSDAGSDNTYALGDAIRITVTFDEAVDVDTSGGAPRLKIDMDPAEWGEKWASYDSGSGTTALVFTYTVVEPNISTQGIAVVENSLELNGGSIQLAADEDADLAHYGLGHDANHKVDWRPSTFTESVSGPYVTAIVADLDDPVAELGGKDMGAGTADGGPVWWEVSLKAVPADANIDALRYKDLPGRGVKVSGWDMMNQEGSSNPRTAGDRVNWNGYQGYVVRVSLSDLVGPEVDLSDLEACAEVRFLYYSKRRYVVEEGTTAEDLHRDGEAKVWGCRSYHEEADPNEARVLFPVMPMDSPDLDRYSRFVLEAQLKGENRKSLGPVHMIEYGPRNPDSLKIAVNGQWWVAIAMPYAEIAQGIAYSECDDLTVVVAPSAAAYLYGHESASQITVPRYNFSVENCWAAPLPSPSPGLVFPVQIRWDPVAGADGFIVDVVREQSSGIPLAPELLAPSTTAFTFTSCHPSGDDNMMLVEVRPYVNPPQGSAANRAEWPGVKFALPCPTQ